MADTAITRDAFFDGRLILNQPAKGHRSGTDAVLLAASVTPDFAGLAIDVGAGVGAVGLGVALACPKATVQLIEQQPAMADLAVRNISANAMDARVTTLCADLFSRDDRRRLEPADLVLTNPPFYEAGRVRSSPTRRDAHVLAPGTSLEAWLVACLDLLKPNGTLVAIHAAAALADLLAALDRRAGNVAVKCIHPRQDGPALRVLVRATKGSRAPLSISPPLVLHEGERFTSEADSLHKGRSTIVWR